VIVAKGIDRMSDTYDEQHGADAPENSALAALILMNDLFPTGFFVMIGLFMPTINPGFLEIMVPVLAASIVVNLILCAALFRWNARTDGRRGFLALLALAPFVVGVMNG
jgi:hypothetical protein